MFTTLFAPVLETIQNALSVIEKPKKKKKSWTQRTIANESYWDSPSKGCCGMWNGWR